MLQEQPFAKYFGTFASNEDAESTDAAKSKKNRGRGANQRFSNISKFGLGVVQVGGESSGEVLVLCESKHPHLL